MKSPRSKVEKSKEIIGCRAKSRLLLYFLAPIFAVAASTAFAQQPQAQSGQPILAANAKYVQGVGPGYWPTAGAGLTLNVAPGTSYCNLGVATYAGGSLALAANSTNYVYLDPTSSCAPASNTSGFQAGHIPVAKVTTSGSAITSVVDARNWFAPLPCTMNSSGATTCASQGANQSLTLSPSGTGSTILNGKVGVTSSLYTGVNTVAFSSTPAFDASAGNTQQITLTGNVTNSTLINATRGQPLSFDICQDATGGRSFSWPANVKSGPVVSVLPSTCTHQSFTYDGTNALAGGPAVDDAGNVLLPNANESGLSGVLLTPFHAFLDEGAGGLEIATNVNTGGGLINPGMSSWDLCLSCGGGEFSVWYAPATSGNANYSEMWSIDSTGAMRNVNYIYTPRMNNIRYADQFPGADAGAQIIAAIADLPATGGIVNAEGLTGPQVISSNFLAGLSKPVTFRFGAATFATVNLVFPAGAGLVNFLGAGMGLTKFIASAANTPVFSCATSGCDNDTISDLSVQANAGGSSGPAIDTSGFRFPTFRNIEYFSNGSANFNSFYHFSAYPYLDYFVRVIHPVVSSQTGPPTVFLFDNGGQNNALYNANGTTIEHPVILGNTGITTIIDARRSADSTFVDGEFEHNLTPISTILIPGKQTRFRYNWVETDSGTACPGDVVILGQNGADGASTDFDVSDNYFSGCFQITVNSGSANAKIENNSEEVNETVNDSGTHTVVRHGSEIKDSGNDVGWWFTNSASGGSQWLIGVGNSSGYCGAGVEIYDATDGQCRFKIGKGSAPTFTASATGQAALQLAPASASSSDPSLSGLNQGQTQTLWSITAGGSFVPALNTVTFSATPTFDASKGNTQKITLTGNVTSSTLSNAAAGQFLYFEICQDATGSRTFVWPSNVKGGMTIGSTASKCSAQSFIFDGTSAYAVSPGVSNM